MNDDWGRADIRIQADRLYRALVDLVEACEYVSPIVGAVATKPSVQDIRLAGNFVKAYEKAKAVLSNFHEGSQP